MPTFGLQSLVHELITEWTADYTSSTCAMLLMKLLYFYICIVIVTTIINKVVDAHLYVGKLLLYYAISIKWFAG